MIVSKFGGTSVQDADAISRVINIISKREDKTVIVVSAFAKVTDGLINIINDLSGGNLENALTGLKSIFDKHLDAVNKLKIESETKTFLTEKYNEMTQLIKALDVLGEISPKSKDMIISLGEILSSNIVFQALKNKGFLVEYIDPRDIIQTDSEYNEANVDFIQTDKYCKKYILNAFKINNLVVTGGFVGSDSKGTTTTLGRGGSDYSASVIASAIGAEKLEIWTDVSGIMTSDPKTILNAGIVEELSYTEAAELAYFGAKVLHPKTIFPAVNLKIPVWVLNTFKPDDNGTKIVSSGKGRKSIKAIAFRKGIIIININSNRMLGAYGFLSKVFEIFKNHETSVDLVTTSEVSISLTIDDNKNLDKIISELKKFSVITVQKNKAIVCVVGEGIKNTAGIANRFFNVLDGINISMVSIGASDINLSIVIDEKDLENTVKLIHNEFFPEEVPEL